MAHTLMNRASAGLAAIAIVGAIIFETGAFAQRQRGAQADEPTRERGAASDDDAQEDQVERTRDPGVEAFPAPQVERTRDPGVAVDRSRGPGFDDGALAANRDPASIAPAAQTLQPFARIGGPMLVKLIRGQKYQSPSGNHYLVFQDDGNLVVYTADNRYVWGIQTVTDRFRQSVQVDLGRGNIVVRDVNNAPIWSALSDVRDARGAVRLGPTGALEILASTPGNPVLWSSNGGGNPGLAQVTAPLGAFKPAPAPAKTAAYDPIFDAPAPPPAPAPKPVPPKTAAYDPIFDAPAPPPAPAPKPAPAKTAAYDPIFDAPAPGSASAEKVAFASRLPVGAGEALEPGKTYPATSGGSQLTFQKDGNIALKRADGAFVWGLASAFRGYAAAKQIAMQADGALVALDASGKAIWSPPQTRKVPGSSLDVSPSGALQVVAPDGEVTWSSNGNLVAELPIALALPISAGQALEKNKAYPAGRFTLRYGGDGNLVVGTADEGYQWGLKDVFPAYATGDSFRFEKDGTLAVRDKTGKILWTPPLAAKDPNAQLTLNSAGALLVVSPTRGILWSSTGILSPAVDVFAQATESCAAVEGWPKCIKLASPGITIRGSRLTTDSAMKGAAGVYQQMFDALRLTYPKSGFDGFTIYMTNGEPYAELRSRPPAGTMSPDIDGQNGGNFLRGGASTDFLWIEEQMICKNGVVTRNIDLRKSGLTKPDNNPRSFDQVVHEIAHSMEFRYPAFQTSNNIVFGRHPMGRTEGVPNGMQNWFGVGGTLSEAQRQHYADNVFTKRVAFSCDGYKP